jgi:hypothetical protein
LSLVTNLATVKVKFEKTVKTLGELVKDDIKLGTLYMFLILVTPGSTTSHITRVSSLFIIGLF